MESSQPNRAGLVEGPVDLYGRTTGRGAFDRASRVAITKNAGGSEDPRSETSGNDDVVVLSWLVCRDEHGVRLADMNIERGVSCLKGVCSLHLYKLQLVTLNPEVEGML